MALRNRPTLLEELHRTVPTRSPSDQSSHHSSRAPLWQLRLLLRRPLTLSESPALSQGYFWKGMKKDCEEVVEHCRPYQLFLPIPKQPAQALKPITSPWPFAQWGLDIVGKLPTAPGGFKFHITTTDYFSKWVKAEPLVTTTEADVRRFVWRDIVTRFGVPYAIVSDNGSQFVGK